MTHRLAAVGQILGEAPDTLSARFALRQLEGYMDAQNRTSHGSGDFGDLWFYRLPDFSPSLNRHRLALGLPVGGLIGWSAARPVVPPGIPANGCGMAVARLARPTALPTVLQRLANLSRDLPTVGGHRVRWDAGRKNHFLSMYSGLNESHYAILHCSFPEAKLGENRHFDLNGRQPLRDGDARAYIDRALIVQRCGLEKRRIIMERLFPGAEVISNRNHVKFLDDECVAIGCYAEKTPIHNSPITVGPRQDALLVSTMNPTKLPGGRSIYLQPHGTGNSTSTSGEITADITGRFYYSSDPPFVTDTASDVFDTHAPLRSVRPWLARWIDAPGTTELRLVGEVLLRDGWPEEN